MSSNWSRGLRSKRVDVRRQRSFGPFPRGGFKPKDLGHGEAAPCRLILFFQSEPIWMFLPDTVVFVDEVTGFHPDLLSLAESCTGVTRGAAGKSSFSRANAKRTVASAVVPWVLSRTKQHPPDPSLKAADSNSAKNQGMGSSADPSPNRPAIRSNKR